MRQGSGVVLRPRIYFIVALFLLLTASASAPSASSSPISVDWTSANANSMGTNSVRQDQLTPGSAGSMGLAWSIDFPAATLTRGLNATGEGSIAPPLIVNGTVFVVMNDLEVIALNAETGGTLWSFTPTLNRTGLPLGKLAGHVHGLAYHDGSVWLSLPDCSAIAIDARTGTVSHSITRICAGIPGNSGRYDYSGTPLVFYKDLVIWTASSVSEGTDAGRGFVAAYYISNGSLAWRWYVTPPSPGDPNWDSKSCPLPCHGNVAPYPGDWGTMGITGGMTRAGAGPGWGQPAVDTSDGLVILGTSQASPDWNATYRPGPDLYSDSIIALNAKDGAMSWFFQTTPHDLYDFDCGWNVVLGSAVVGGVNTTTVFKACKNGYVYAIAAISGQEVWEFHPPSLSHLNTANAQFTLTRTYNATESWVTSEGPYEQCPGINGGIESDISVSEGRVYVATHNFCSFITVGGVGTVAGSDSGAVSIQYDMTHANTTIYALDESTGASDWSYFIGGVPYRGWLTSTGGLVFASTLQGDILAIDSSTGSLSGTTHVGSPLYEGLTVGTDASGKILAFQLTSSPSYGAFTGGVPGSLLAFVPNSSSEQVLPWVIAAVGGGAGTIAVAYAIARRRKG